MAGLGAIPKKISSPAAMATFPTKDGHDTITGLSVWHQFWSESVVGKRGTNAAELLEVSFNLQPFFILIFVLQLLRLFLCFGAYFKSLVCHDL